MSRNVTLPIAMKCKGLHISLVRITLKNVPGALAKVASLMAKYNINILSSILDAPLGAPKATMISFIDYSKIKAPLEQVIGELKELNDVLEVDVIKPQLPGLIVNELFYSLTCLDDRCVLIHISNIGEVLRYLYERFGPAAKTIMYHAGYGGIKDAIGVLKKITGLKGLSLMKACLRLFQAYGFGRFQVTFYRLKEILVVRAYDLFECEVFRGKLKQPNSHIFRGILAYIAEEVVGKEVEVEETKCIAKGDPYCQFVIRPRE